MIVYCIWKPGKETYVELVLVYFISCGDTSAGQIVSFD
jgi:hypothetical protein